MDTERKTKRNSEEENSLHRKIPERKINQPLKQKAPANAGAFLCCVEKVE